MPLIDVRRAVVFVGGTCTPTQDLTDSLAHGRLWQQVAAISRTASYPAASTNPIVLEMSAPAGGDATKAATDAAAASETLVVTVAHALTDTTAASETATAAASVTTSETAGATEALTSTVAHIATDAASATDSLALTTAHAAADTVSASEQQSAPAAITAVESAVIFESLENSQAYASSETLQASEALTTGATLDAADSTAAADTLALIVAHTLTETATAAEVLTLQVIEQHTAGDEGQLSETLTAGAVIASVEGLALSETGTTLAATTTPDAITAADDLTLHHLAQESAIITESLTVGAILTAVETLASDDVSEHAALHSTAETTAASETVETAAAIIASETAALTESASPGLDVIASDVVTVLDAPSLRVAQVITDAIAEVDALSTISAQTAMDLASAVENAIESAALDALDAATIAETWTVFPEQNKATSELITAVETGALESAGTAASEEVTGSDALFVNVSHVAADSIGAADALATDAQIETSDAALLNEHLSNAALHQAAETVSAAEAGTIHHRTAETLDASDSSQSSAAIETSEQLTAEEWTALTVALAVAETLSSSDALEGAAYFTVGDSAVAVDVTFSPAREILVSESIQGLESFELIAVLLTVETLAGRERLAPTIPDTPGTAASSEQAASGRGRSFSEPVGAAVAVLNQTHGISSASASPIAEVQTASLSPSSAGVTETDESQQSIATGRERAL